jgi:hypothetical protein
VGEFPTAKNSFSLKKREDIFTSSGGIMYKPQNFKKLSLKKLKKKPADPP